MLSYIFSKAYNNNRSVETMPEARPFVRVSFSCSLWSVDIHPQTFGTPVAYLHIAFSDAFSGLWIEHLINLLIGSFYFKKNGTYRLLIFP